MKIMLCFCWFFLLLVISQAAERLDEPNQPERAKLASLKYSPLDPVISLKKIFRQLHKHKRISPEEFNRRCANPNNLDFNGLDFTGFDLSYLTIKNADFSRAKLRKVSFYNSVLTKIKFCQSDCTKTDNRKMTLIQGDYTGATLNGSRFKGATLIDILYKEIGSSKGCLIEDSKALRFKLARDKEIRDQIQSLNGSPQSIRLSGSPTSESIYQTIYEGLLNCQKRDQRFTLIDFKKIRRIKHRSDHSVEQLASRELLQYYIKLLRTPHFKEVVARVHDQIDDLLIVVEINMNEFSTQGRQKTMHFNTPKLDLHGKTPLQVKRNWVDQFIKKSHAYGYPFIEIITGRGLHNPSGILGQQWSTFRDILKSEKYRPYIKDIYTSGKNGGWRVELKDSPKENKFKDDDRIKYKSLEYNKVKKYVRFKKHQKSQFLKKEIQEGYKYRLPIPLKPTPPRNQPLVKTVVAPQKIKEKSSILPTSSISVPVTIPNLLSINAPQPGVVCEKLSRNLNWPF